MEKRSVAKRALTLTGLLLILALVFVALPASSAPTGYSWQPSPVDDCIGVLVCADWVYNGQPTGTSCCIRPEYISTSNFGACDSGP